MIKYTELRDAVLGFLEIDSTDKDRFQVDENLNKAQEHLLLILPLEFISNAVKTSKTDLKAGQSAYQWPDDYIRFVAAWVDYKNTITYSNPGKPCTPLPDERFIYIGNKQTFASENFPMIDLNVENGFAIYPEPQTTVTEGIRIRYVYSLPNISSTQDSLLRYSLKNLLVYYATSLSALIENYRPNLASAMQQLFQDELNGMLPKEEK
ncbi:MAG: hypothetical protein GXO75_08250 [Calditrichaeota bacterium]|nr:hypothetical protein [Calditrichota bacterium]